MTRYANAAPLMCPKCRNEAIPVGKLPQIGLRPLIYVYKCDLCRDIMEVKADA